MAEKTKRVIVTFYTTAEAMATDMLCREAGLPGKLISAPRSLSPDCGIAWSAPAEALDTLRQAIEGAGIEVSGFHELVM